MTNQQRLTVTLPLGEIENQRVEDIALTAIDNLKLLAWNFVRKEFGVSPTLAPERFFFTVPAGFEPEQVKQTVLKFVGQRWTCELPEPVATLQVVDAQGYLV